MSADAKSSLTAAAPVEATFKTALAILEDRNALAVQVTGGTVPAAQVEVLRKTICSKLTDEQLLLYLVRCHRKGIDPFTDAYAFPQSDGGLAMGLRIDGMRALAMNTGAYLSRVIEPITDPKDPSILVGARCTIVRAGMSGPVVEEAYLKEYNRGGVGWSQFPETMIRKVAEAKALRAAFADALAGIYEPAEMDDKKGD
jgi:hypothetical protein